MSKILGLLLVIVLLGVADCEYTRCNVPATPNRMTLYQWDLNLTIASGQADEIRYNASFQYHQYFGCYSAPCSIHNEAYWLGNYGYSHPKDGGHHFFEKQFEQFGHPEDPAKRLSNSLRRFIEMRDSEDNMIPTDELELRHVPYYGHFDPPLSPPDLQNEIKMVPNICDPRAFLYCRNSIYNTVDQRNGQDVNEPAGARCACHPMYSIQTIEDGVTTCKGLANTPCGFYNTADTEEYHELDPLVDHTNKFRDENSLNVCDPPAECRPLPLRNFASADQLTELDNFRAGRLWRGFGYSPILTAFILRTASHTCQCGQGFKANVMHSCVKTSEGNN